MGEQRGLEAVIFELSARFSVESSVSLGIFECHPGKPLLHASFYDASCLDLIIPGVFRVTAKVTVIDNRLY